ncbi:MAG: hypothetical protein JSU08_01470 [Acidobacteria bacterium]|nr:hypothetical protein [Acidobacteriota bacterium]
MARTIQTIAGLAVCSLCLSTPFVSGVAVLGAAEDSITLKGCLVKGDGDGAGYLLTNTSAAPAWQRAEDTRVQPGAVGTSGGYESVFYWLDGDNDLKKNIGHLVEIKGDLKGDLKDGEIKLERKDRWTELTVKSDDRTMKANVPNASVFAAPNEGKEQKNRILVRKVDVDHVSMLAATCDDAR